MKNLNQTLGSFASFAPLVLRVVLGGLFLLHGIDKFQTGLGNVEQFFASNGVPAAALSAPLAAVLEVALGIALILGLFTRVSAAALAGLLVVAIVTIKADGGILGSSETDLAYIAGLVALVFLGPGRFALDDTMGTERTVIDLRSASEEKELASAGAR